MCYYHQHYENLALTFDSTNTDYYVQYKQVS